MRCLRHWEWIEKMKARYKELLDKSIAAMLAAIEVYNKPDFKYREETFSVIAINSWELALKAYLLKLNSNRLQSLFVYEAKKNKNGTPSRKQTIKMNRSGTPVTHSVLHTILHIEATSKKTLPKPLKANIFSLIELRDNAIHFYNRGFLFTKRLQELGSASLKNYVQALHDWFDTDLSHYNMYLMPISFLSEHTIVEGLVLNPEEEKFLNFVDVLESKTPSDSGYDFTININVSFTKSDTSEAIKVKLGKNDGAVIQLTDEQVRKNYPWDHGELVGRLKERFIDFQITKKFNELKKAIIEDERYVKRRYLDPDKPKSGKKDFYNPNIIQYFDKHYQRH